MTNLADCRSCGVVLSWPGPQATLSSQGLVEGGGPETPLNSVMTCFMQYLYHVLILTQYILMRCSVWTKSR